MFCGKEPPAIQMRDRAAYQEAITIATIYNQATLTYSGGTVNSNITQSELSDAVTVTKTPVSAAYEPGGTVSYAVGIVNTGTAELTGLTVTDDLGGYAFEEDTIYPLTYVEGSMKLLIDGVPQAEPTVESGPPMTVTGLTIPAGGSAVLVYEARVSEYAPLGTAAQINNTVTVTGAGTAVTAIRAYGDEPATPDEARAMLSLPSVDYEAVKAQLAAVKVEELAAAKQAVKDEFGGPYFSAKGMGGK